MDKNLKTGWTKIITPSDLDKHMLDIGQAEVNAELAKQMLEEYPLKANANLLIHGCGTSQILNYIGEFFKRYALTFADLNEKFLIKTRKRLSKCGLKATVIQDDIETTNITETYDGIMAILLLEHVDWRRGIASITKLNPQKIYLIIQEEDKDSTTITIAPTTRESIRRFSEIASPKLVEKQELIDCLTNYGYSIISIMERAVTNGKKMIGLTFQQDHKN